MHNQSMIEQEHYIITCVALDLKIFFLCRNLSLEFILLITFRVIDSSDIVSSNIQPKYVAFGCCFICIFLLLTFSFGTLFILRLEPKSIDLVLSPPK